MESRKSSYQETIFGTCTHLEQGTEHVRTGKPCEDTATRFRCKENGVACIALSDGAGHYEHALEGSTLISQGAAQLVAEEFDRLWNMEEEQAARHIIGELTAQVERAAKQNRWPLESMYATLLCAAMHPDGRWILFHVGDGFIAGLDPAEGCEILSQYEHTGATNETTFVIYPNTEYHLIRNRGRYASFLLSSDGAEHYFVVNGLASEPVWAMLQASFVISENEMAQYMHLWMDWLRDVPHAYDDLSFAVISDYRQTKRILLELIDVSFLEKLLGRDQLPMDKKSMERRAIFLQELHMHPNGVDLDILQKKLYLHGIDRLKKKMERLFPEDMVTYAGRFAILR